MQIDLQNMKIATIITRLIGLALLILGIYMFVNDKEYSTSFDSYNGGMQDHKEVTINYIKVVFVGLIVFFYREIRKYLDYVKYS